MEVLMIGIVTAINLIILKWKFEQERWGDLVLDVTSLYLLSVMFGNTMSGMVIAMIASAIISTYLYFNPPKWTASW